MGNREKLTVRLAGHDIAITASPEEAAHVDRAAKLVNEQMEALQSRAGGLITQQKTALMVAFQNAFDLSMAEEAIEESRRLRAELERQRDAMARLEGLLGKVDDALTY